MFLKERHDKIIELINSEGRVTVTDLAELFSVTDDCIRKDLKQLDAQGKLQRVYGGAVSVASAPERNITKRLTANTAAKRAIAEKAYALIHDDDTVFLDVSTTTLAIAELLAAGTKQCTVISNMMEIMRTLAINPLVSAVCTGGAVSRDLDGFVGSATLKMVGSMRFDRSFIGALAVDLEDGSVLTYNIDDGSVKELVIRNSSNTYLVADTSKLSSSGTYRFANIGDFNSIIMESFTDKARKAVARLGSTCL